MLLTKRQNEKPNRPKESQQAAGYLEQMKNQTSVKQPIILCAIALFFVVMIYAAGLQSQTPTIQAIRQNTLQEERQTFAHNLNDRITKFFEVYAIDFPRGTCTSTIEELYNDFAYRTTEITSGFRTTARQKFTTLNFGIETTESIGTIDMVKGKELVGVEDFNAMISLHMESIARASREDRRTFFMIDLYGNTDELFKVKKGKFSIPSLDCEFTTEKETANCTCKTHTIKGFVTD